MRAGVSVDRVLREGRAGRGEGGGRIGLQASRTAARLKAISGSSG